MFLKNATKNALILIVLIFAGRLKAISSSQIYATEVLEDWSYLMKNRAWREKSVLLELKLINNIFFRFRFNSMN